VANVTSGTAGALLTTGGVKKKEEYRDRERPTLHPPTYSRFNKREGGPKKSTLAPDKGKIKKG